jgi:hypothetical protein
MVIWETWEIIMALVGTKDSMVASMGDLTTETIISMEGKEGLEDKEGLEGLEGKGGKEGLEDKGGKEDK